ncbi:MAG: SRPBCC domain-containing protein [Actinomycetota bacterium]
MEPTPVGKTRDAGWQIGVSRTVPHEPDRVWDLLMSPDGLAIWLGEVSAPLEVGDGYRTADGTVGEVRSLHPGDRIRLTWQPPGRHTDATIQIAVSTAATGTTVRFHTERLTDGDERERIRAHWIEVADRLRGHLDAKPSP